MAVKETQAQVPRVATQKLGLVSRLVGAESEFQTKRAIWGYVYALPWIVGLVIFWGGPILASLYFGFTEYAVIGTPRYIGAGQLCKGL